MIIDRVTVRYGDFCKQGKDGDYFTESELMPFEEIEAPKTDWKKAFEMLKERIILVLMGDEGEIKHKSIVIQKILKQCTKGGE